MHSLHVVHADASLKNMLLFRDGIVKVADFGTSHTAHTALGSCRLATYYVNAPEMWLGQLDLAPAVDIWAWGVMLYMLSSGKCDWLEAATVEEVIPLLEKALGPIDEASWPGHSTLPKWPAYAENMLHGLVPKRLSSHPNMRQESDSLSSLPCNGALRTAIGMQCSVAACFRRTIPAWSGHPCSQIPGAACATGSSRRRELLQERTSRNLRRRRHRSSSRRRELLKERTSRSQR